MADRSILLALDGSMNSKYAADVCWKLARGMKSRITAQHVVDLTSAWDFVGHDSPGFLSASDFTEVYDEVSERLYGLGEKLLSSYEQATKQHGLTSETALDQGNPLHEICKRALLHDIVVIGHRAYNPEAADRKRRQLLRLSLAESLAHDCQRPLLVVQSQVVKWDAMTILLSMDHVNETYLNACLDLCAELKLYPSIVCLSAGGAEEPAKSFAKDLRTANPRLEKLPIAITKAQDGDILGGSTYWDNPTGEPVRDAWGDTLIVIPTREIAGERITVVGSSPSMFVRYLTLPAILLWPEETGMRKGAIQQASSQTNKPTA